MNLGVLLGHARVPGTPLKLPGELSCRRPSLPHCGHTQTQVEFVTLQPVPDVFDYLPPGGIAAIRPSSPINLRVPSAPLVSNHEYTSGLIVRRATAWTVAGPKLSGVVWVWDDTQSSTAESQALKEA